MHEFQDTPIDGKIRIPMGLATQPSSYLAASAYQAREADAVLMYKSTVICLIHRAKVLRCQE